jgi:formate hydrogenlyase subunit 6/NADH:ubiquinone oxidoreductase subunit I
MPGRFEDTIVTIQDVFEAVGRWSVGEMSEERVRKLECAAFPGEGSCAGFYTANTMACMTEAMGMSLPGCAAIPAVDAGKLRIARDTGETVVTLVKNNVRPNEIITEKGEKISKRFPVFDGLSEIRPHPSPAKKHAVKIAPKEFWPAKFNDDFWAETAERCLSCRICAYVCPSCRCFDVRDEALPGGNGQSNFERVRCWDSCNGIPYRRVAGGHNPRFMKNQRLRNRFYCKFYYFPLHYGPISCTGCGRCIDACSSGAIKIYLDDHIQMFDHLLAGINKHTDISV